MNKKIIVISICLFLIGAGMIGYYFYDQSNNSSNNSDENDNSNENIQENEDYIIANKIDESKPLYYTIDKEEYAVEPNYLRSITFEKPVININSEDVINLNEKLYNKVNNLKEEYKKEAMEFTNTCIQISDKKHCDDGLNYYSYLFKESKDYLSVLEHTDLIRTVLIASGYSIEKAYVISKKDGKVLDNKLLIESLGNNYDKFISDYQSWLNNLKTTDSIFEEYETEEGKQNLYNAIMLNKNIDFANIPLFIDDNGLLTFIIYYFQEDHFKITYDGNQFNIEIIYMDGAESGY